MKTRHILGLFLVTLLLLTASRALLAQAAPAGGALQVLEFKPGLDDLMTMVVQPRHLKLFYAGRERNWELAAFQVRELRASFRRTGQAIPIYRTQDFNKAVATMATPALDRLDEAIKAGDSPRFDAAYRSVTESCNACHRVMEHAFLVIKVPEAAVPSSYANQEFGSAK